MNISLRSGSTQLANVEIVRLELETSQLCEFQWYLSLILKTNLRMSWNEYYLLRVDNCIGEGHMVSRILDDSLFIDFNIKNVVSHGFWL